MRTPIVDFVRGYKEHKFVRLHMPGHKGRKFLGCEDIDITEITGADVLYSPDGVIAESEIIASDIFGTAHTFYSCEGSSLCIRAMMAIVSAGKKGARVLAGRNSHKAFLYACGLLDIDVSWVYPEKVSHICECDITPSDIEEKLSGGEEFCAVYLTSPDYLGHMLDIKGIAEVCHAHGVPLVVDNAHGAYSAFLENSLHPIHLGADMCCDSAHKTLPVLTGGAYLHISKNASADFVKTAREKLEMFASTSPSYLILQSLDLCNEYLSDNYRQRLSDTCKRIEKTKGVLAAHGYTVCPREPLKIVLDISHTPTLPEYLHENGIEVEFSDRNFCVMMFTPENSENDFLKLEECLGNYTCDVREAPVEIPHIKPAKRVMSVRESMMSKSRALSVDLCEGKICAQPTVSCPPAVPVVVSGELIEREHIECLKYYHIEKISVVE